MLLSLAISNFVLIDKLEINFSSGLTILTGETGAGKSIIIDALGMIMGSRAESRLLQKGAEQATIIGEFDTQKNKHLATLLQNNDIENSSSLLIRRVLFQDGRSKAYLNDTPVSLSLLQDVSAHLVEIHGQHDQRGLLDSGNHLSILDSYAQIDQESTELSQQYSEWKNKEEALLKARQEFAKAKAEEEYLTHALAELTKLNPQIGEEEKLAAQRVFMQSREKIVETVNQALSEIREKNDIVAGLQAASRILSRNSIADKTIFVPIIEQLDKALVEADEALVALENLVNTDDFDLNNLEQLEDRFFALKAVARKHNRAVDELPALKQEIEKKLSLIDNTDTLIANLEKELKAAKSVYSKTADIISKKRYEVAAILENEVSKELAPLKMAGCKIKVEFTKLDEDKWSATGKERAQFLVQTNPGSNFGPINKIASGGELSRFMLALKVVLSGVKSTPTIIFDEIDTGIGGATADAVGKRLSKLGKKYQVLTITHQPQVAAYGDQHLRVEKVQNKDKTVTSVIKLSGNDRKEEVARMLAGATITKEARAAAEKLMGADH